MKTARVRCVICLRSESIAYDDAGVTGRSQVEAFAEAAEAAGWVIRNATVHDEIFSCDRCPEHRHTRIFGEILETPV